MAAGLALQAIALGWMAAIVDARPSRTRVARRPVHHRRHRHGALLRAGRERRALGGRPEEEGQASGANNALREVGGVFGIAVLAAIFAHYGGYRTPPRAASSTGSCRRSGSAPSSSAIGARDRAADPEGRQAARRGRRRRPGVRRPRRAACRRDPARRGPGTAGDAAGRRRRVEPRRAADARRRAQPPPPSPANSFVVKIDVPGPSRYHDEVHVVEVARLDAVRVRRRAADPAEDHPGPVDGGGVLGRPRTCRRSCPSPRRRGRRRRPTCGRSAARARCRRSSRRSPSA